MYKTLEEYYNLKTLKLQQYVENFSIYMSL